MTEDEFVAAYTAKGWTQKQLAERWGLHRTRLWQIARDPARAPFFADALAGLPAKGRLPKKRAGRPRGQVERISRGLRYRSSMTTGSLVQLEQHIGDIDEYTRGIVLGARRRGDTEEYVIVFESGHVLWLEPDMIDTHVATIGIEVEALRSYRFKDEEQVAGDLRAGAIRFP